MIMEPRILKVGEKVSGRYRDMELGRSKKFFRVKLDNEEFYLPKDVGNSLLASQGLETVTYSSTDFAEGYRTLFSSLLAPIAPVYAPPVLTGHYLVEANRLDGTNGIPDTESAGSG